MSVIAASPWESKLGYRVCPIFGSLQGFISPNLGTIWEQ